MIDADQDYFECEIGDFADELPLVSIARHEDASEAGPQVILLQGLAKGDKMETVIRHATEVGVAAFVPLACARSIVKLDGKKAAAKTERWRAIAKNAAMQSGQARVPEVATCTPAADARIAVVVGPEGGLAEEEVRCFLDCNARARLVTLGPSILRTETAGIVAPALVLYELGGMGNRPSPTYEGNRG